MADVSFKCWFCEQTIEPRSHFRSHLKDEKMKYEQLIRRADDYLNYNHEEDSKDPLQGLVDDNDFTRSHNESNLAYNFIQGLVTEVVETVLKQGSSNSVEFVVPDDPPISENNPNNVISNVDTEPFELIEFCKDENVIEIDPICDNSHYGQTIRELCVTLIFIREARCVLYSTSLGTLICWA